MVLLGIKFEELLDMLLYVRGLFPCTLPVRSGWRLESGKTKEIQGNHRVVDLNKGHGRGEHPMAGAANASTAEDDGPAVRRV
jgi:hypothetical protein